MTPEKLSTPPESGRPAIVAVSGGRDSLLALSILARQNMVAAAALGRFLPDTPAHEKRRKALQEICRTLDIPLLALDLRQDFRQRVIAPFARAYARGRTPNPCALCNPALKFDLLYEKATAELARLDHGTPRPAFATGHYARIIHHPRWGALLAAADDHSKDQSYFLAMLPKELLPSLRFPLAGIHKQDVPGLLQEQGLEPPDATESQEICFIPDNDYRAFLERNAADFDIQLGGDGPALLPDGAEVGRHKGLWRYTQGQRRGLGIPHSEPLYVLGKDMDANALLVGGKDQRTSQGCILESPNLFVSLEQWPSRVLARTRYRQQPRPVAVTTHPRGLALRFLEPEAEAGDGPPAPGQLGVVSDKHGHVLGAGAIATALMEPTE